MKNEFQPQSCCSEGAAVPGAANAPSGLMVGGQTALCVMLSNECFRPNLVGCAAISIDLIAMVCSIGTIDPLVWNVVSQAGLEGFGGAGNYPL